MAVAFALSHFELIMRLSLFICEVYLSHQISVCRFADGSIETLEDFVQETTVACTWEDAEANSDTTTIDRVHAELLHYDEFVVKYMQPNYPVLIQASSAQGMMRIQSMFCIYLHKNRVSTVN